jgi:hypothetical protein
MTKGGFVMFNAYARNCREGADNNCGSSSGVPVPNNQPHPFQKINQQIKTDIGYHVGYLSVDS